MRGSALSTVWHWLPLWWSVQGLYSLRRCRLISIGIPIINLRRSSDRLRFIMGIPIPVRRRLLSEKRPSGRSSFIIGLERRMWNAMHFHFSSSRSYFIVGNKLKYMCISYNSSDVTSNSTHSSWKRRTQVSRAVDHAENTHHNITTQVSAQGDFHSIVYIISFLAKNAISSMTIRKKISHIDSVFHLINVCTVVDITMPQSIWELAIVMEEREK